MHNSCVGPESVHSTKNNTHLANPQGHRILSKNTALTLEFTYEVGCQWHPHITQAKDEKPNAKQGHCSCCSTLVFQCFGMSSIILVAHAQKQRWAPYSVCLHCHNASNNTYFVLTKLGQNHHTHVSYTTVCYYFFLVHHAEGCLAPINNTNLTNCRGPWTLVRTSLWELVHVKALLSIGSLFQLHTPLLNTSRSTPFYVSFRLPLMLGHLGHFHCKRLEKAPPLDVHQRRIDRGMCQKHVVCSTPSALLLQYAGQHSQTSYQGIQYLLICCTHFTRSAPTESNQLEHGLQGTFVQYVKTQSIQSTKSPKQETFQRQLQCIEGLAVHILSIPAAQHCLRHQSCCQLHHPKA